MGIQQGANCFRNKQGVAAGQLMDAPHQWHQIHRVGCESLQKRMGIRFRQPGQHHRKHRPVVRQVAQKRIQRGMLFHFLRAISRHHH